MGSHRTPASIETTIERIFRKVVRRKMTAAERSCFQLKPATQIAHRRPKRRKQMYSKS